MPAQLSSNRELLVWTWGIHRSCQYLHTLVDIVLSKIIKGNTLCLATRSKKLQEKAFLSSQLFKHLFYRSGNDFALCMWAHLIVATWYKFQLTRQLGGSRQQNMPTPVKIMLRGSCLSMYNEHTLMRWEQQWILWLAFMSASNKWCNKQQHSIFQTTQISNYILYRGLSRECTPEEYWTWLCSILQRECTPLNSGPPAPHCTCNVGLIPM